MRGAHHLHQPSTAKGLVEPAEYLSDPSLTHACDCRYLDGVRHIVRTEGYHALYAGLRPTILGIVPYSGLSFAAFETIKVGRAAHSAHPQTYPHIGSRTHALADGDWGRGVASMDACRTNGSLWGFARTLRASSRRTSCGQALRVVASRWHAGRERLIPLMYSRPPALLLTLLSPYAVPRHR
eukprot:scaffold27431_cov140-Isochrysis_galbana.AAC.3